MEMRGSYKEITPPARLVSIESWGGEWPETVTLILSEKDSKTTITLMILYLSKEARDAALKRGMIAGMSQGYDRLDKCLRTMA